MKTYTCVCGRNLRGKSGAQTHWRACPVELRRSEDFTHATMADTLEAWTAYNAAWPTMPMPLGRWQR